jgi:hypothetical protein
MNQIKEIFFELSTDNTEFLRLIHETVKSAFEEIHIQRSNVSGMKEYVSKKIQDNKDNILTQVTEAVAATNAAKAATDAAVKAVAQAATDAADKAVAEAAVKAVKEAAVKAVKEAEAANSTFEIKFNSLIEITKTFQGIKALGYDVRTQEATIISELNTVMEALQPSNEMDSDSGYTIRNHIQDLMSNLVEYINIPAKDETLCNMKLQNYYTYVQNFTIGQLLKHMKDSSDMVDVIHGYVKSHLNVKLRSMLEFDSIFKNIYSDDVLRKNIYDLSMDYIKHVFDSYKLNKLPGDKDSFKAKFSELSEPYIEYMYNMINNFISDHVAKLNILTSFYPEKAFEVQLLKWNNEGMGVCCPSSQVQVAPQVQPSPQGQPSPQEQSVDPPTGRVTRSRKCTKPKGSHVKECRFIEQTTEACNTPLDQTAACISSVTNNQICNNNSCKNIGNGFELNTCLYIDLPDSIRFPENIHKSCPPPVRGGGKKKSPKKKSTS